VNHLVSGRKRNTYSMLAAGVLLLGTALFWGLQELGAPHQAVPAVDWDLTLIGRDGQPLVLSYEELKSLPAVETRGGFFSSVGVIYGPYQLKGIQLEALLAMVGGMTASDVLLVAAQDGYSSVFDYRQITGEIDTFEPGTLRLVPQGAVEFLLIYQQDGEPLSDADGKPLRLGVTNPDGLLTEGHWWVKWVNRLEVRSLAPTPASVR
jgi:DMSO/TMAO reductase YedYZ molybdopterin-dependent catalytic subunit